MISKKGFTAILALLLPVMLLLGFRTYSLSAEKAEIAHKNQLLEDEVRDFGILKSYFTEQVDSLHRSYDALVMENARLQGSTEEAYKMLAEKAEIIKKLKKTDSNSKEVKTLKLRVEELLKLKAILEKEIADLREENRTLKAQNSQLSSDLASALSQNEDLTNLNRSIQEEMKRLSLANFQATAFQVEVEKRKTKLTTTAKRARKVRVSFDLTKVAPEYQEMRPLYLVLTNDKGTPVKVAKPIFAKVNVNGQETNIQALIERKVSIEENQRLSFSHELDEKLRPGLYRFSVYTDEGLLGATSFRLQ